MKRLGLTGRLLLILSVAVLVIQMLAAVIYLSERRNATAARLWLPFPDQLEAMVSLFDIAGPTERALLARAFSDGAVLVALRDSLPAAADGPDALNLPMLSARLRGYSDVLGDDRIAQIAIPASRLSMVFPRIFSGMRAENVRITVGLHDGHFLVIQRRPTGAVAVGGLPAGMLAGMAGAGLAVIMGIAVWRETKPLRRMGEAAEQFGQTLQPQIMPDGGAHDLARLARTMNQMQDRIARLDRSRTDMIAAIAHDIRTPLTRLQLRLRKLDPDLQEAAERDVSEIVQISEAAARYAAADLAVLDQTVDLRGLGLQVALQHSVPFADVTPDAPAVMAGNSELLARCIGNLVGNALRYGRNATLELSVQDALVLIVDDDGPGIPPQDRARLLRPFERGDPARMRATGEADGTRAATANSGLGLAIAHRVAQHHGGRLTLEDSPMGGLRVLLVFPRAT